MKLFYLALIGVVVYIGYRYFKSPTSIDTHFADLQAKQRIGNIAGLSNSMATPAFASIGQQLLTQFLNTSPLNFAGKAQGYTEMFPTLGGGNSGIPLAQWNADNANIYDTANANYYDAVNGLSFNPVSTGS